MFIIDFILHIDAHIYNIAHAVGGWTYLILFLVIFIESGAGPLLRHGLCVY